MNPPLAEDSAMLMTSHSSHSNLSSVSPTYATAVDMCMTMYGETTSSSEAVERIYEPSASDYENPVLTASSRSVITDIHQLSRQLSVLDVPRPVAMFCTLFRLHPPQTGFFARNIDMPMFQALRVWTEIGDICENETFDGHRKTIVEHTLNILVLPGIHRDSHYRPTESSDSLVPRSPSSHLPHPNAPGLPILGTSLTLPSPFHFKLHIITRLSFNEQGRITHHRDFWDVKDVMGLVPGVSLAQWIGTRLAAKSVTYAVSLWSSPRTPAQTTSELDNAELGLYPAAAVEAKAQQ
ncbi:hypothetical protein FB45DRAFT_905795 [Roridomyces roridus]|uniref:Uncharacterized protein n=1 Tax=Roridomyces roridus TaxID=1738132 RepID=A0AAD7FUI5_9AGAR|nr:hypothetical protein FB45DRAFT_905795 [Roridomyces roridus]